MKRKLFVFTYAAILLLITTVLGVLMYIIVTNFSFYDTGGASHESTNAEREELVASFNTKSALFETEQEQLTEVTDIKKKEKELKSLLSENKAIGGLITEILKLDEEILNLKLDPATHDYYLQLQEMDRMHLALNSQYDTLLSYELILNGYYTSEQRTNDCFADINYTTSNKNIINAIGKCVELIEIQNNELKQFEMYLPTTFQYLAKLDEYWDTNKSLYKAIDAKQKEEVTKLQKQLRDLAEQRDDLLMQSSQEIEGWLASEVAKVEQVKLQIASFSS